MKALRFVLLVSFFVAAGASHAEELSAEKRADIARLLEITGALDIGKQMSVRFVEHMAQQLRRLRPDVPNEVVDVLEEEVNAVVEENLEGFKELVIPLYHKHFSHDDIKGIIRIYSTDLGKKMIRVMPVLMNDGMIAGQMWGRSLEPVLERRIRARFKKEGYEI